MSAAIGQSVETPERTAPQFPKTTHTRTYQLLVRGKNINETTLLATDYLNHFNEIIMLLEMVPSMPECLEDCREWQPKSYSDHFRESCFADAELAVWAYENAPHNYRVPFDRTIEQMNRLVLDLLRVLDAMITLNDTAGLEAKVEHSCQTLRKFIDVASSIIHGQERTIDQSEIDGIMDT